MMLATDVSRGVGRGRSGASTEPLRLFTFSDSVRRIGFRVALDRKPSNEDKSASVFESAGDLDQPLSQGREGEVCGCDRRQRNVRTLCHRQRMLKLGNILGRQVHDPVVQASNVGPSPDGWMRTGCASFHNHTPSRRCRDSYFPALARPVAFAHFFAHNFAGRTSRQ